MQNTLFSRIKVRRLHIALAVLLPFLVIQTFTLNAHALKQGSDLGPSLKYIGKHDNNCLPFPFAFICSGAQFSDYYYETNLNLDELKTYFKKASFTSISGDDSEHWNYKFLKLQIGQSDELELTLYGEQSRIEYNIKSVAPTVLEISEFDYQLAKSAL